MKKLFFTGDIKMSKVLVLFKDVCNNVVFAVTMAIDVSRYLKEERDKDTLCLQVG